MDRLQLRLTGRAGSQDDCDYFQFQIHNKEIRREESHQSEAIIESIHEETEETDYFYFKTRLIQKKIERKH